METLEERLQREARKSYETFNRRSTEPTNTFLDQIISHTISETLKEAVKVIEGEKRCDHKWEQTGYNCTLCGIEEYFAYGDCYFNEAITTTLTTLEGLQDKTKEQ